VRGGGGWVTLRGDVGVEGAVVDVADGWVDVATDEEVDVRVGEGEREGALELRHGDAAVVVLVKVNEIVLDDEAALFDNVAKRLCGEKGVAQLKTNREEDAVHAHLRAGAEGLTAAVAAGVEVAAVGGVLLQVANDFWRCEGRRSEATPCCTWSQNS
jgi:hypothetical protein